MHVSLVDAIKQLRDDLRQAIAEGAGQDIIFTPRSVELELAITFTKETTASGGLKLLLDISGEKKSADSTLHKIKLTIDIADKDGNPIKVSSKEQPSGLR